MLTKLTIRNFKLFEEVEIPLGSGFVFIGPNNGGKTTALQALTLWWAGLQKWLEITEYNVDSTRKYGVAIGRLELLSLPVDAINLIWHNRKIRKDSNTNILIDLIVEGINNGKKWQCGLEFEYSNSETLFCRPLRLSEDNGKVTKRMEVPQEVHNIRVAFLPPMSGLASEETLIQEGRINVLTGQGQTAEVLRNLCYRVYTDENKKEGWNSLVQHIQQLFGVTINPPKLLEHRGAVMMDYIDRDGKTILALPSSGRGMQQVLLLLAYLYDHPTNTVFLLDEPDAHLEILRQREIYQLLTSTAKDQGAQIISASHSEVLLNEAAQRESVVAFVGKPHILGGNQTGKIAKALAEIGYQYYYDAERLGWILYLEGRSDLRILQEFAKRLQHPVVEYLKTETLLIKYIESDQPQKAREHFHALREAKNDLRGILIMDSVDKNLQNEIGLLELKWQQREIENYLCTYNTLIEYAGGGQAEDIFGHAESSSRKKIMEQTIDEIKKAVEVLGHGAPFSKDIKASDNFLVPLFKNFTSKISPALKDDSITYLSKPDFYQLVAFIPEDEIDNEVIEKLDAIVKVAEEAKPVSSE